MKKTLFILLLIIFYREGWTYSRLVSLKPSATDMIFALGEGDKLVGVTTYCKRPSEAQKIEKVGGYSNPNVEKIISLKPDLVVLIPDATSPRVYEALQRAHIDTLVLKGKSLNDIFVDLETLGEKLGVAEKAKTLSKKLKTEIDQIKQVKKDQSSQTAYMVVQRKPLIVAGGGTFLSELLALAGFKNLGESSTLPYPRLNMETFLQNRPDVIFDIDAAAEEDFWGSFPSLPAVRNQKVIHLPADLFVPDTHVVETLKEMLKSIQ